MEHVDGCLAAASMTAQSGVWMSELAAPQVFQEKQDILARQNVGLVQKAAATPLPRVTACKVDSGKGELRPISPLVGLARAPCTPQAAKTAVQGRNAKTKLK
jgi:hypothetical protein